MFPEEAKNICPDIDQIRLSRSIYLHYIFAQKMNKTKTRYRDRVDIVDETL